MIDIDYEMTKRISEDRNNQSEFEERKKSYKKIKNSQNSNRYKFLSEKEKKQFNLRNILKCATLATLVSTATSCTTFDKYNPMSARNEYENLPKILVLFKEGDNLKKEAIKYVNMNKYDFDRDMLPALIDLNKRFKGDKYQELMILPCDLEYIKNKNSKE